MIALVLDFVRRWKYIYFLALLFASGFTLMSLTAMAPTRPIFPVAIYLGAFLLAFDFTKGSARVLATLPLSRLEVGRAWFHLGVTLPGTLSAALRFVLMLGLGRLKPGASMDWTYLFIASLWDFAYAGGTFFLLTLQPRALQGASAGSRNLAGGIWGGSWGLSFGSVALVANLLPGSWNAFTPLTSLLLALAMTMTLAAYLNCRVSATLRLAFRPQAKPETATRIPLAQPSMSAGLTGASFLLWSFSRNFTVISLGAFIAFSSFELFLHGVPLAKALTTSSTNRVAGQNLGYWFFATIMVYGMSQRVVTSIRHWRVLPLSTWQLELLCLLPTWVACLIVWLIPTVFSVVVEQQAPATISYVWLFGFIAVCSMGQALFLRWRSLRLMFVILFMLQMGVLGSQLWFNSGSWGPMLALDSFYSAVTAMAILFAIAIWVTHRSITAHSLTYKATEIPFGGPTMNQR